MRWLKWILPFFIIIVFIIYCGVQYGNIMNIKHDVYRDYKSVEEINQSTNYEFIVPEIVKDTANKGNNTIQLFGGELVIIDCENIKFRVAPKAETWADVLGIEYPSEISKYYEVENSNITNLRYREGYEDNTLAYNWYTDELMYGIISDDSFKLEDLLKELGLDANDIIELGLDGKRITKNEEVEFKSYTSSNKKLNILVPETNTRLDVIISGNAIIFNMSNKLIMYVTSDIEDSNKDKDTYEFRDFSGYRLAILKENPFKEDTDSFKDFSIIKDNLDRIVNSAIIYE